LSRLALTRDIFINELLFSLARIHALPGLGAPGIELGCFEVPLGCSPTHPYSLGRCQGFILVLPRVTSTALFLFRCCFAHDSPLSVILLTQRGVHPSTVG